MTARDAILSAVRRHALPPVLLPGLPAVPAPDDLVARFASASEAAGARVVETEVGGVAGAVRTAYPDAERVGSTRADVPGGVALDGAPHALADLDLFVCGGTVGVAENGAVWLPESALGSRAAPFLAPHVAIVLHRNALVGTMHEAYAHLDGDDGFGVFVAGPSKTADIEQSLVVGAHGPISLTVVLVGDGARGARPDAV